MCYIENRIVGFNINSIYIIEINSVVYKIVYNLYNFFVQLVLLCSI